MCQVHKGLSHIKKSQKQPYKNLTEREYNFVFFPEIKFPEIIFQNPKLAIFPPIQLFLYDCLPNPVFYFLHVFERKPLNTYKKKCANVNKKIIYKNTINSKKANTF